MSHPAFDLSNRLTLAGTHFPSHRQ